MRKVIAFALFGGHPTYGTRQYYWDCLPGCLRSYKNFYPDFEFRVYHDKTIDEGRSTLLRHYHYSGLVSLHYAEENQAVCRSMLWRIKPIWDEDVDVLLCRDMDGAACRKERRAVDIWLESNLAVHTINDNPSHTEPMMGGMVGFRPAQVRTLLGCDTWDQFVAQSGTLHEPTGGHDQILMRSILWNRVLGHVCSHRFAGMPNDPSVGKCHRFVDDNWPADVALGLQGKTEGLVPFIGCSGVDVPKAREIYDQYGDPELAKAILSAEKVASESNVHKLLFPNEPLQS